MNASHQRESAIFDAAMDLPPAQRQAYLNEACGGDIVLRGRVESLLKACDSQCAFLDSPPAPECPAPNILQALEKPGDMIGRYKLLEQIGEGGCGVVYVAEQTEPVRRRVALKIIKLGMDTRSVIARFEAERQALAMMDHPNIAKVFDAGATETGRPYFVMELVRGLKITDYCDQAKLSFRARLDLFIQVCQAIQHAHQKGIIHRDIKPSNILVTVNDGAPIPKVIDFGIAKATAGQQLTDKTIYTAFEQFIGTPAYMSPEQAVLTSLDIDTRSDIYALGVLLYELLTGKTPFDAKELLAIGLDEMRRTIREQDPQRPSTRLSTLPGQELSTTAQRRGLEAPKLVSELRGDLDWIVMKALEKDRARRYETANGLATDVQRHLNNEPVVASPPSRVYRFEKMVRRNKLAFASAVAVATALLFSAATSTWMYVREREARKRAVAAEQKERKLREEAELRERNTRAFALGSKTTHEDRNIGLKSRTEVLAEQRRLLGSDHLDVAESLMELARLLNFDRKHADAEKACREALAIYKKHFGDRDIRVVNCLHRLAFTLESQGNLKETEATKREMIEISREIRGSNNAEIAYTIHDLGLLIGKQGRISEALPLIKESFTILRKLRPDGDRVLGQAGGNLLSYLLQAGQTSEAASVARQFVAANVNTADALSIGAMALYKLNQKDRAKSALAEAQGLHKAKDPEWWDNWMRTSVLLREASALIEPSHAKTEPTQ